VLLELGTAFFQRSNVVQHRVSSMNGHIHGSPLGACEQDISEERR